MLPSHAHVLAGADRADSLIVNPHKWLFTPFDLSAFYCRRMDVVRAGVRADAGLPEHARSRRGAEPDGHRHSARTPVPRAEAVDGPALVRRPRDPRTRLSRAHPIWLDLAASWIDAHPDFERLAPVPLSVVCFRWTAGTPDRSDAELDAANEALIDLVNSSGDVFLSHTRLRGRAVAANCDRSSRYGGAARAPRVGAPADGGRAVMSRRQERTVVTMRPCRGSARD